MDAVGSSGSASSDGDMRQEATKHRYPSPEETVEKNLLRDERSSVTEADTAIHAPHYETRTKCTGQGGHARTRITGALCMDRSPNNEEQNRLEQRVHDQMTDTPSSATQHEDAQDAHVPSRGEGNQSLSVCSTEAKNPV
jgi:hypothetical protein